MRTAILTGASSGIGQAIKASLITNGWRVISLNRSLTQSDGNTYLLDLNDLLAVAKLGRQLTDDLPQIDGFVHVAGVWHDDHQALAGKQLQAFTPEQIISTVNVGLTSAMVLCNALLPRLQNGTAIGISGTFADGAAGWLPYYTSKRALEDFLVGLSQDQSKVKVFGISPVDTATPAYAKFYPQYLAEAQPPTAIADLVLQLLDEKAAYKSGDIIEVRNGKTRSGFHV